MDLSFTLLAIITILAAASVSVLLFQRLGFGSVLGFIVAGILVGPYTPGPIASRNVEGLQGIAELGVVLFLFTVGLEMRPSKLWAMRRLLFGLGSAQMLVTAGVIAAYGSFLVGMPWESAVILGLGLAMSSTAIIMATLGERGEMASEHGKTAFAVLMAQDLWIVPIMALIPVLAHQSAPANVPPLWQTVLLVIAVIAGIFIVGRYLLPRILGYCAENRRFDALGLAIFLAVLSAAWLVEKVGISMTLGAFLIGMLLSASDFRYQIEAIVSPFKQVLMALFFLSVGMSIDVRALAQDWSALLVHVPTVLLLKLGVLIVLAYAFGISKAAAIRTGFYLSQAGEFAFVLLGAATVAGLLTDHGHVLAMLIVSITMILTPMMVQLGNWIGERASSATGEKPKTHTATDTMDKHVVVVGYDQTGRIMCLMLERVGISFVAFDRDIHRVRDGRSRGHDVHFGDMYSSVTQEAAGLANAAAAYVSLMDTERAKGLAVTLHRLYPHLDIYLRVATLDEQEEMIAKGIKHAATGFVESTLMRGSALLKDIGVSEQDIAQLVSSLRADNFALLRAGGHPSGGQTHETTSPSG
jgi:monovalent cation:proton antiporter-2 (CPA2) family protein